MDVPLFHNQPMRKAGRPKGAKAKVVQDMRSLGVHHFAFVRSSLLGLDLASSFQRYLAWSETTTDLRYVHNRVQIELLPTGDGFSVISAGGI
jgi:hypothetical protein